MNKQEHHLFLIWLMLAGVVAFGLYIAWQEGLLLSLYRGDKSRLSWAITLLFALTGAYCARRVFFVSAEIHRSNVVYALLADDHARTQNQSAALSLRGGALYLRRGDGGHEARLPPCMLTAFLLDLLGERRGAAESGDGSTDLLQVYEARLKNPHNLGWFFSDIMIKLGLLGTIIGFVLMLASIVHVSDFDVSAMQDILRQMSAGMGTALYTTFAGLACSIVTATQFHLLDQGADELLEQARHLTHAHVLPRFGRLQ